MPQRVALALAVLGHTRLVLSARVALNAVTDDLALSAAADGLRTLDRAQDPSFCQYLDCGGFVKLQDGQVVQVRKACPKHCPGGSGGGGGGGAGGQRDHALCSYFTKEQCDNTMTTFEPRLGSQYVREGCPDLCGGLQQPQPQQPQPQLQQPPVHNPVQQQSVVRPQTPVQAPQGFQPPTNGGASQCIPGGYSQSAQPSSMWDKCTGRYTETCVRDVDVTDEQRLFESNPSENWYRSALGILRKVYPWGAEVWEFQRQKHETPGGVAVYGFDKQPVNYYEGGLTEHVFFDSSNFWEAGTADEQAKRIRARRSQGRFLKLMQVSTPVHESCHVHHMTMPGFRPLSSWEPLLAFPTKDNPYAGKPSIPNQMPRVADPSWDEAFPHRGSIWDEFPEWVRENQNTEGLAGPNYFDPRVADPATGNPTQTVSDCKPPTNGQSLPLGCQGLFGLLTEAECYMHGIAASMWMTRQTGGDYSPKAGAPSSSEREGTLQGKVNTHQEGGVFPLAFWQYAQVLYLQKTKEQKPTAWANLKGTGAADWTSTAATMLAHHDRTDYLLGLSDWSGYDLKDRTSEIQGLTAGALMRDNVIGELRQFFINKHDCR